jgi:hypothetical protein
MLAYAVEASLEKGADGFARVDVQGVGTSAAQLHAGACHLLWRQQDINAVLQLTEAGGRARASTVDTMLRALATERTLMKQSALAAQMKKLEVLQRRAARLEAAQMERSQEARLAKAALLQQQLHTAESRAAQLKVRGHARSAGYVTCSASLVLV